MNRLLLPIGLVALPPLLFGCAGEVANAGSVAATSAEGGLDATSSALGPGCLGSPGMACNSRPGEVVMCPGEPTVCLQCSTDLYVTSPSFCRCTSGTWDCVPPEAGTVTCPNPMAGADLYVDPACSMPYGSMPQEDAGADAGACTPVLASDYDQSCDADTDCIGVGERPGCPAAACDGCPTAAINKAVSAQYTTALSQAFASGSPQVCNCPCIPTGSDGVCRGGKCQVAHCAPPQADTLPACANAGDAGGVCGYSANTTCDVLGPPDACAYSDEICCL
jgi:hypothetical protein